LRRLHNEELHNRVIKSRRMRWVGHAAYKRNEKSIQHFFQKT